MTAHEHYDHRILVLVSADRPLTQRMISRDLDIALGLVNRLVRRLIDLKWIGVRPYRGRACRYAVTPAGLREKARLEAAQLEETISLFADTRDRLRDGLRELAAEWAAGDPASNGNGAKRVVLYGDGEMAQIAYLAMCDTELQLVGVVDDCGGRTRTFLGLPVHSLDRLSETHLDGDPFGRLVVVSPNPEETIRARLAARGISDSRVFFLGVSAGA